MNIETLSQGFEEHLECLRLSINEFEKVSPQNAQSVDVQELAKQIWYTFDSFKTEILNYLKEL